MIGLRWRRVVVLATSLVLLGLGALAWSVWRAYPEVDTTPPAFRSRLATVAEQRQILSAIADSKLAGEGDAVRLRAGRESDHKSDRKSDAGTSPVIVLTTPSASLCAIASSVPVERPDCTISPQVAESIGAPDFDLVFDVRPGPALAFRQTLLAQTRMQRPMVDPGDRRFVFMDAVEARALISNDWQWARLRARHPGALGIMRAGWAVVAEDGREALIYTELMCGSLCGGGEVIWLDRLQGRWWVRKAFGLWVS